MMIIRIMLLPLPLPLPLLALLLVGSPAFADPDPLVVGFPDGLGAFRFGIRPDAPVDQVRFGASLYSFRMEMRALPEPAAVFLNNPDLPEAFRPSDNPNVWIILYRDHPELFKRLLVIGLGSKWPWQDADFIPTLGVPIRLSGALGGGPINAEGLAMVEVEWFKFWDAAGIPLAYCQPATLIVELEVPVPGDGCCCKTRKVWAWIDQPQSLFVRNSTGDPISLWKVDAWQPIIWPADDECRAFMQTHR